MRILEAVRNIWACVDANVKPGENVVIVASSDLDPELYSAVAAAAEAKGAEPVVVIVKPPKQRVGELSVTSKVKFPKALVAVCKSADVVCQLTTFAFGFSTPKREAMRAGVRWFGFPTYYGLDAISYTNFENEEKGRVKARIYADLISKARTFRLLSNGEELTGKLGRRAYAVSYLAEPPAYVGYWGDTGEAMSAPLEGTSEGSFIVDGAIHSVGMVKKPLKFTVRKGVLVDIEDSEDTQKLERVLKEQGDENSKILCELAVGTNPAARLHDAPGVHEIKEGEGRIHIGFGDNHNFAGGHPELAGKVESKLHWDVVILKPSLELDGKLVVEKGKLLY